MTPDIVQPVPLSLATLNWRSARSNRCCATCPGLRVALLLIISSLAFASESAPLQAKAKTIFENCLREIDRAVTIAESSVDLARRRHAALETSCGAVPQLWHNKAVFAFNDGDWEAAAAFFNRSIALDHRTSHSVEQLRSLYEHQAALAYHKALGSKSSLPNRPALSLQNSQLVNAGRTTGEIESRDNIDAASSTSDALVVQQAVLRWWNSLIEKDTERYANSYVHSARADLDLNSQQWVRDPREDLSVWPAWHELNVSIELIPGSTHPETAIAVLVYQGQKTFKSRMLMLSVEETHWKIFRERQL